jgi:hypothetical protein
MPRIFDNIDKQLLPMNKPFNPADIDITNKLLTIDLLITRLKQSPQEIQMDTSTYFQRKSELWTDEEQSRLIESILIRFPLPAFYFDGENDKCWLIVDGLQRLMSLENFIVKETLKLKGLEFLIQLEGKSYREIGRDLQRVILETQIIAFVINQGSPSDVKFNLFKRINTGGLVLNPQEIRHALNQGVAADFLSELASLESFKKATGDIPQDRMLDREYVNRFLAFYFLDHAKIERDIDAEMDNVLKIISNSSSEERDDCKRKFDMSMQLSFDIFGKHAFRKWNRKENRRNPLNKALFDVVSVVFAKMPIHSFDVLKERKSKFLDAYFTMINEEKFIDSITAFTGEQRRINLRYERMNSIVSKVLEV